MNALEIHPSTEVILTREPDKKSESSDLYFVEGYVFKVLKRTAALYQFCENRDALAVAAFLTEVEKIVRSAFGDAIPATQYDVWDGRVIITQPIIHGRTVGEFEKLRRPTDGYHEFLSNGLAKLRGEWQGDRELLGFIVDEISHPENIMISDGKFFVVDWL